MKKLVQNKTFDEERALYNVSDTQIVNCNFEGPMKKCKNYNYKIKNGSKNKLLFPFFDNLKNIIYILKYLQQLA